MVYSRYNTIRHYRKKKYGFRQKLVLREKLKYLNSLDERKRAHSEKIKRVLAKEANVTKMVLLKCILHRLGPNIGLVKTILSMYT